MDVMQRIKNTGVLPVVVIDDAADAVPTAQAMLAGGVGVMEITFRTAAAAAAIRAVSEGCPDMLVGAGTVITLKQCQEAVNAGAKFIVTPGLDEEVVRWCAEAHIPVTPGCATPTEMMAAMRLGVGIIKFFPADVCGGLKALKAVSAPLSGIQFIPTGGVNAENLAEYLRAPFVAAAGGSWLCPKAAVSAHDFARITRLCAQARQTAIEARKGAKL